MEQDPSNNPINVRSYPWWVRLSGGLLLSLMIVFGSLFAFELILRIADYGTDPRFYRIETDENNQQWFRENRDFTHRFFPRSLIRRPQSMKIALEKPEGTIRIFVLGSSAAMGDPEASFSMARVLECLLAQTFPERSFEVINAGMTAVNSHVVRRVAEDLSAMKPDVIVVYEGNNEVIGPFGPTGVLAPFFGSDQSLSLFLALRSLRSWQWVGNQLDRTGYSGNPRQDWGGMGMFVEHALDANDPRLQRVYAAFRSNMEKIANHGVSSGAMVIFCTVLTNERDFAPFLSAEHMDQIVEEQDDWQRYLRSGNQALEETRWEPAAQEYSKALVARPDSADLLFRKGRALLAQHKDKEAAVVLREARDRDLLRFRTDTTLNQIVRDLGSRVEIVLVDLVEKLGQRSAHGVPGDDLLYEHVHLNFWGTYQTAMELFSTIVTELPELAYLATEQRVPPDYPEVRLRLGYTLYEQAMIASELLRRFQLPPFSGQADAAARVELWTARNQTMREMLRDAGQISRIKAHYEQALLLQPDDWILKRNYGMALTALQEWQQAAEILHEARLWIADDPDLLFANQTALRALGRSEEADALLVQLKMLEPHYPGLDSISDDLQ